MTTQYDPIFKAEAERTGLEWRKLKAQAMAESRLDPDAVSKAGAMGLAQFMPATWPWVWRRIIGLGTSNPIPSPFDPDYAIEAQAAFMAYLLRRFVGNWPQAWAAYNWGEGNVKKALARWGSEWEEHLPAETSGYIARIERLEEELA